mmetsp:Transcript_1507/g.4091  ORF Transcript_1507/g.4091 Transcript_1507/m.4091 type:complete len:313 (-) Transcript_1507:776-1714(-)
MRLDRLLLLKSGFFFCRPKVIHHLQYGEGARFLLADEGEGVAPANPPKGRGLKDGLCILPARGLHNQLRGLFARPVSLVVRFPPFRLLALLLPLPLLLSLLRFEKLFDRRGRFVPKVNRRHALVLLPPLRQHVRLLVGRQHAVLPVLHVGGHDDHRHPLAGVAELPPRPRLLRAFGRLVGGYGGGTAYHDLHLGLGFSQPRLTLRRRVGSLRELIFALRRALTGVAGVVARAQGGGLGVGLHLALRVGLHQVRLDEKQVLPRLPRGVHGLRVLRGADHVARQVVLPRRQHLLSVQGNLLVHLLQNVRVKVLP